MDKILVVIPTVMENKFRYKLLEQLNQEDHVKYTILVDNGDNLNVKKLTTKNNKLQIYRPGYNMNWLKSCNWGAKLAISREMDFVCFMNDDVQLSPFFFPSLLDSYDYDCGVVGPSQTGIINPKLKVLVHHNHWQPKIEDVELSYLDGTCMLIPVPVLKQVGLLDEHFQEPGWGADLDFCYRVRQTGLKVIGTKRAMLWHHNETGGCSAEQIYGSRKEWIQAGIKQLNADMISKHGKDWRDKMDFHV